MSSAHPFILNIGGVDRYIVPTFALWCRVEAKFGALFPLARRISSHECLLSEQADLLALFVPEASRDDVEAHFNEAGHITVALELQALLTRGLRGWSELSEEVAAGDDERPPEAPQTMRRPRADKGRPRGPRRTASSRGETSPASPQLPVSSPANSGDVLPLTSLPLSAPVAASTSTAVMEPPANDADAASPQLQTMLLD